MGWAQARREGAEQGETALLQPKPLPPQPQAPRLALHPLDPMGNWPRTWAFGWQRVRPREGSFKSPTVGDQSLVGV